MSVSFTDRENLRPNRTAAVAAHFGTQPRFSGHTAHTVGDIPYVGYRINSPGYLAALGTPLIRGRLSACSTAA